MTKESLAVTTLLLFVFLFFVVLPHIGFLEFIGIMMKLTLYVVIPVAIIAAVFIKR